MSQITAPNASNGSNRRPIQGVVLTEDQVVLACDSNIDMGFIDKFPRVDKLYADPIYNNQVYCTHSFVPVKGATPDADGVFGFIKCRGTFQTEQEAYQRSEWLVRNCDSYNPLQTTWVGRPFPIGVDMKKYIKETVEIDIKKKSVETHSEDVRKKREDEKRNVDDIKRREENLVNESNIDFIPDPLDIYIETQVRRANLVWAYKQGEKKMQEMKDSIIRARKEIVEFDSSNPEYRQKYFEKYLQARKDSGFPDVDINAEDNFIKYMVQDVDLGF